MADCAKPQPDRVAPENITSVGDSYVLPYWAKISCHCASVPPSTADTNCPIWSEGAPVRVSRWGAPSRDPGYDCCCELPPPDKISAPPISKLGSIPSQ